MYREKNKEVGGHASFKVDPLEHREEMEKARKKAKSTRKNRHKTKKFINAVAKRRATNIIAKQSRKTNR